MSESQELQELRARIMAIQRDTTLSAAERAQRIQREMAAAHRVRSVGALAHQHHSDNSDSDVSDDSDSDDSHRMQPAASAAPTAAAAADNPASVSPLPAAAKGDSASAGDGAGEDAEASCESGSQPRRVRHEGVAGAVVAAATAAAAASSSASQEAAASAAASSARKGQRRQRRAGADSAADLAPAYRAEPDADGKRVLGCSHYVRGCKMRAACCGKLYVCRLCHNDNESHEIDRYATQEMLCMHCGTLQPVAQTCTKCSEVLGAYYCPICKFWDSTPGKEIYHCPKCNMCRLGKGIGIDMFHCDKCVACMHRSLENNHRCVERTLDTVCPICRIGPLFTSTQTVSILPCGHAMHHECMRSYSRHSTRCPTCCRSFVDESGLRRQSAVIARFVRRQPMPREYHNHCALVFCNDCERRSVTEFHFAYMRCVHCFSYNTTQISHFENKGAPEVRALAELHKRDPSNTTLPPEDAEFANDRVGDEDDEDASNDEAGDGNGGDRGAIDWPEDGRGNDDDNDDDDDEWTDDIGDDDAGGDDDAEGDGDGEDRDSDAGGEGRGEGEGAGADHMPDTDWTLAGDGADQQQPGGHIDEPE